MTDFDVKHAEDYKEIFANKFLGRIRPGYFEIDIITDNTNDEDSLKTQPEDFTKAKLTRIIHAKLYIPLYHLEAIQNIITQLKPLYEKNYGEIKLPGKEKLKDEKQPTYVS